MKKFLLSLVLMLSLSVSSFAHLWELSACQNADGSITVYGQVWHPVGGLAIEPCTFDGGLTINNVNYDWTNWLPGARPAACQVLSCSNPTPNVPSGYPCPDGRCSYVQVTVPYHLIGSALTITVYSSNVCFDSDINEPCTYTVPNNYACGKNLNKVQVQHQTGSATNPCISICIDPADVASHLAHGDVLGECPALRLTQATADHIQVYPNPASGNFTVTLADIEAASVITVSDMLGKTIATQSVVAGTSSVQFNLSNNAKGLYIVKVQNGNETLTTKMVIE